MDEAKAEVQGWSVSIDTPVRALFEWCAQVEAVDRLLLSARLNKDTGAPDPRVENGVTALFEERVLARKLARSWPGTELIGHLGLVYEIAFDPSLVGPMAQLGPRLEDWTMSGKPPLPEDPCLFRRDSPWPVLISVTHENDAWILSKERPPFSIGLPFVFRPENLIVPSADCGFILV